MYTSLMTDLLSIKADLPRAIELAARHRFGGVDVGSGALGAPDMDVEAVREQFARAGVRPGYIGMSPGRVPVPESVWQIALAELPLVARRAQQIGYSRAALVVLPFHETLAFEAAFAEHVRRSNQMTTILDDYGIALALEYVSPVSRRSPYPHAFVHDLAGMLRLCDALDSSRVGILLDSFHWHCAGETAADLERLTPARVVVVHVNDAPPVPREAQVVGERTLPGATGVIDIAGFMGALKTIGYDGPVTCEPMASAIAALGASGDDELLSQASASLDAILPDAG
ncbi:MAG: sugar phosphate isomerase/epimerase [Akkermansiaceae bacterium]|nr:sugar phosphate isomerase/epimerase [Armatimonadota bacterium]